MSAFAPLTRSPTDLRSAAGTSPSRRRTVVSSPFLPRACAFSARRSGSDEARANPSRSRCERPRSPESMSATTSDMGAAYSQLLRLGSPLTPSFRIRPRLTPTPELAPHPHSRTRAPPHSETRASLPLRNSLLTPLRNSLLAPTPAARSSPAPRTPTFTQTIPACPFVFDHAEGVLARNRVVP